jgi:BlaI family transcriptional regulator, penicillinase repressor
MARTPSTHPTDGELELLQILWQAGPTSLGHICAALRGQRPIATTTVATMLKVMLDKGLIRRKHGPRGYLWSAKTTRQTAANGMIRKLVDRVFDGSAQRLVAHLLESGELSGQEQKELQRLMEIERKSRRDGSQ